MLLPQGLPDYHMGESGQLADVEEINFFSVSDSNEESESDTINCFYSLMHRYMLVCIIIS